MQAISNLIAAVRLSVKAHPFLALLIVIIWLAFEYISFGPYSYLGYYDSAHFMSSQLALQHGDGAWYRYGMGGLDLLSTQFVVPIGQFLTTVLPGFLSYQLQVLVAIGGSASFTYLLLRRHLLLEADVSLIGATAFALHVASSYVTHQLDYALFPAVIWLLAWVTSVSFARAILGIIFLSFIYASLSLVVFAIPFIPIGTAMWFMFIDRRRDVRFWILTGLFWICYGGLKIPDIWSLILNLPYSQRILDPTKNSSAGEALTETLATIWSVVAHWDHVTLLALVTFGMLLFVRPRDKLLNRALMVIPALAMLMLISLWVLRGTPFFVERGLSTFSFVRMAWIVVFFVLVASAIALNLWPEKRSGRLKSLKPGIVGALVIMLFGYSVAAKLQIIPAWSFRGGYNAVYAKPAVQELADTLASEKEPFRAGVYYLFSTPLHAYGIETVGGWYSFYSIRNRRYLNAVNNFIGLTMDQTGEIIVPNFNISLLSLANVKYIVSILPLPRDDLEIILQPEQLTWELSLLGKLKFALRYNFGPTNKFFIYRNPSVLPRFFFTRDVRLFQNHDDMLRALAEANLDVLRHNAFLVWPDAAVRQPPRPNNESATITLVSSQSDNIVLDVDTDGRSFLVATNSYSPYWKAYVDGVETTVLPAYDAFWGIEVDHGQHRVEWRYEPPSKRANFLNLNRFWSLRWIKKLMV